MYPASYQTNHRYLNRQVEQGKLDVLGEVRGSNGRPKLIYGRKCKCDNLLHEFELSAVLVHLEAEGWEWCRGASVNPRFRADAEIRRYGQVFRLELDRGTRRRHSLQEQLERHAKSQDFVLYVVPSERRMREVKELGENLREQLLCTTFAKAAKDPFDEIWEDVYGHRTSL